MPFDSIICRKNLDEERGNPWICECPMYREERITTDEGLFHGDRVSESLQCESKDDLPETVG